MMVDDEWKKWELEGKVVKLGTKETKEYLWNIAIKSLNNDELGIQYNGKLRVTLVTLLDILKGFGWVVDQEPWKAEVEFTHRDTGETINHVMFRIVVVRVGSIRGMNG